MQLKMWSTGMRDLRSSLALLFRWKMMTEHINLWTMTLWETKRTYTRLSLWLKLFENLYVDRNDFLIFICRELLLMMDLLGFPTQKFITKPETFLQKSRLIFDCSIYDFKNKMCDLMKMENLIFHNAMILRKLLLLTNKMPLLLKLCLWWKILNMNIQWNLKDSKPKQIFLNWLKKRKRNSLIKIFKKELLNTNVKNSFMKIRLKMMLKS